MRQGHLVGESAEKPQIFGLLGDHALEQLVGVGSCAWPPRGWPSTIESFITDDLYELHTFEQIKKLVTPQVAATLDLGRLYGVWYYNRKRVKTSQVSEIERL